jgi:cyanophycinase
VKGILIPIGGGEDKKDDKAVLERFLTEIGKADPRIEIVTTATRTPREVGREYADAFDSLGSRNYDIMDIEKSADADSESIIARISKADGVFFTGGDQNRIIEALLNTRFLQVIRKRLQNEHFVVAGTSAGCAAMSTYMIQGGTSEDALNKGQIQLTTGLGLIEELVFDTHFTQRGRFARLMNIVATNPKLLCVGFGEDTAAVIHQGKLTVFGSGVVTIIDGSEITYSNITRVSKGSPITIERLIVHVLGGGETFTFATKKLSKLDRGGVILQNKANKWEVRTEGDSAILFSSDDEGSAAKFANEVAKQHNLKVNVLR